MSYKADVSAFGMVKQLQQHFVHSLTASVVQRETEEEKMKGNEGEIEAQALRGHEVQVFSILRDSQCEPAFYRIAPQLSCTVMWC